MINRDNSDDSTFDGHNRRHKARRAQKDRREDGRAETDSTIRRKKPGRRVFDRLLHALRELNQTLKK